MENQKPKEMSATITNWVYESKESLRQNALIVLAKAKELENLKKLKK